MHPQVPIHEFARTFRSQAVCGGVCGRASCAGPLGLSSRDFQATAALPWAGTAMRARGLLLHRVRPSLQLHFTPMHIWSVQAQPACETRVHLFSKRAGATSLRQDYLQIAEGVKNGSLRPLEPAAQPVLWNQTNQRFSNHPLNMCSSMSFGEPFDARMRTSASYSFGNCSRNDAKLVYDQARRRLRRAAAPRPDACIVCRRRRSKSARWGSRRGHRPPTQSRASSGPSPRSPTRRRPVPSWEPTRATARS